jgi:biopolymer transport protein ExbB
LIGLMIVGERFVVLNKLEKDMKAQLASEKIDEANPLGQIMAAFQKYKNAGLETLELKLDEAIIKATPKIKRGITTIKILSGVAPLLGLLGTVTGMILTFQTITLFGTGDPKLMAGGISQALMTTVLGLVCAIPLILLHNFISSKSQRMVQILEEESVGLLAAKEEGALS